MKKYSRQREALLTELRSRYDHPTAEDLYVSLRKVMPNYSLGTVYRNLADLSAEGIILKITSGYGPELMTEILNHMDISRVKSAVKYMTLQVFMKKTSMDKK